MPLFYGANYPKQAPKVFTTSPFGFLMPPPQSEKLYFSQYHASETYFSPKNRSKKI